MSKLSLGVEKALAIRPEGVLVQSQSIVIPDTVGQLTESMNALGGHVMLAGWATAATVFAWTVRLPRGRPSNTEKSALSGLSISGFAALNLRGLKDDATVDYYRERWEDAIVAGWAQPVSRGDVVTLPTQDFSTITELGGLKSSTGNEWYTPARYIEAARLVMGGIDLDPATSELANKTVKAARIFTKDPDDEEDEGGLAEEWHGRVWLNPPYGKGSGLFTTKLTEEFDEGRVTAAVLLINAYGFDAAWFQPLWDYPICFTDHRIEFTSPTRTSGGPANGNIFVYLGPDDRKFAEQFRAFGRVVRTWPSS